MFSEKYESKPMQCPRSARPSALGRPAVRVGILPRVISAGWARKCLGRGMESGLSHPGSRPFSRLGRGAQGLVPREAREPPHRGRAPPCAPRRAAERSALNESYVLFPRASCSTHYRKPNVGRCYAFFPAFCLPCPLRCCPNLTCLRWAPRFP